MSPTLAEGAHRPVEFGEMEPVLVEKAGTGRHGAIDSACWSEEGRVRCLGEEALTTPMGSQSHSGEARPAGAEQRREGRSPAEARPR